MCDFCDESATFVGDDFNYCDTCLAAAESNR